MLDFRILGPLEVRDGDDAVHLGGAKQRGVLAILLLRANEVVSGDRLIHELWGDSPPEDAATALQAHVSRLRKALPEGPSILVTQPPGYVVRIEPEQLDRERFEAGVREGRGALEEGDAPRAAAHLRTALELWRGPPLADLGDEPFVREATAQLEDAWLDALGSRVDADLALGRQAELVPELGALVRAHPLREGFREQLMLALYRTGRQAEALDVYADARRQLNDELGLEPGPALQRLQKQILAHDAALAAPRKRLSARYRRRALTAGVVASIGVLVVAALVVGVALGRDGGSDVTAAAAPGEGEIVSLEASTGAVRRRIPAGRTPSAIAARSGVVWVLDADAQTVLRLSEVSRAVDTFSTGATPTDLAVGAGSAWIANGRPVPKAQSVGPVATGIARLDATTGTERAEVSLPRRSRAVSNLVENHVTVRGGAVWAVTPDFGVVRIEAATAAVTARSDAVPAAAVASGPAGVWVLGVDGSVARLHERTAKPIFRTRVPASSVASIAVGPDAVWVTSPSDGTLWRIGGGRKATLGAIELDQGVSDVVAGRDAIWVANPLAGTLLQVDPERSTLERTIDIGGVPRSLALDGETLWVASVADPAASTVEVGGVRPFPAAVCEPVLAGKGGSDVLIVSDLPLQGGVRIRVPQMTQAIAFVLRERGFRAGRFKVAYQSCDDSVARTGLYDEPKCASNARAYGENPDVIGVIGTFNSPCSLAALPDLNRAPDGPLAMVSPFNSFVGLTRAGPGVDPSLPAALYPTGVRNFARVYPTDDLEGAALALFARNRGQERVFVLDDGEPGYGAFQANTFEVAARRLGLTLLGRETWDPRAELYSDIAARVADSGAEAVYVGGLVDTNAGAVVQALRARLGRRVDLLGPSGLTPVSLLVESSDRAALGMYLSLAGVVTEGLPPAGARWAKRFGETQSGVPVEPSAVYAAQATEVLLDAIARSDGTRASVVRELFETRVTDGLLGSFGFDPNGDISESPVTIVQIQRPGSANTILDVGGARVAKVERPSPDLVAAEE